MLTMKKVITLLLLSSTISGFASVPCTPSIVKPDVLSMEQLDSAALEPIIISGEGDSKVSLRLDVDTVGNLFLNLGKGKNSYSYKLDESEVKLYSEFIKGALKRLNSHRLMSVSGVFSPPYLSGTDLGMKIDINGINKDPMADMMFYVSTKQGNNEIRIPVNKTQLEKMDANIDWYFMMLPLISEYRKDSLFSLAVGETVPLMKALYDGRQIIPDPTDDTLRTELSEKGKLILDIWTENYQSKLELTMLQTLQLKKELAACLKWCQLATKNGWLVSKRLPHIDVQLPDDVDALVMSFKVIKYDGVYVPYVIIELGSVDRDGNILKKVAEFALDEKGLKMFFENLNNLNKFTKTVDDIHKALIIE